MRDFTVLKFFWEKGIEESYFLLDNRKFNLIGMLPNYFRIVLITLLLYLSFKMIFKNAKLFN